MAHATDQSESPTKTEEIGRAQERLTAVPGSANHIASSAWQYRLGMRLLPSVPPALAYRLCELLGAAGPHISVWPRIMHNLQHVMPEAPAETHRRVGKEVIGGLLKNYYDLLRSHALSPTELASTVDTSGLQNLLDTLARGKGVLVTMPHMGNVQLVAEPVASRANASIVVIVERMKDRAVHAIMNGLRQRGNISVVEIGPDSAREVVRALRSGRIVVLATDRTVAGATVDVQFFGARARVPAGPAMLALRTGAPLLPAYSYRQPNNRSMVVIDPPLVLERTDDLQDDVRRTMQAVMHVIESYIRRRPGQWLMTESIWAGA